MEIYNKQIYADKLDSNLNIFLIYIFCDQAIKPYSLLRINNMGNFLQPLV